MNKSIDTRNLTSNLWVWYPSILSREKSFHHKNVTKTVKKNGTNNINKDAFKLIKSTILPSKENSTKANRKGQKEVWTAKKGLRNINYRVET